MERSPYFGVLRELPINAIRPDGWLREFLVRQRNGLTGHLEVAGHPFNTNGWRLNLIPTRSGYGRRWWPYEQYAYWVDGMVRCGLLLNDPQLIRKARRQLRHVLRNQDRDGYLGPSCLKTITTEEMQERWPHAVFFRAFMADHDRAVLRKMVRHYLSGTAKFNWGRNVCNVEILCWLYGMTGARRLLRLAKTSYRQYCKNHPKADTSLRRLVSARPPTDHGVNFIEIAKLPAVLFLYTGDRGLLRASINGFRKLEKHHQLISGVPSSTEHLRGIYSLAGYEACAIADYTWSLGYLLLATGQVRYADLIERACFNAAPGAVTKDFKALQYFSSPNQLVADHLSNHHPHGFGGGHMSYRPNPATECCPGNINRIMPNYAARMWMTAGPDEIAAVLYGPSRFSLRRGARKEVVAIHEDTRFPFESDIRFKIRCRNPVIFTLRLRIPGWCRAARIIVNGERRAARPRPGSWFKLRRAFRNGDVVTLSLPMRVRFSRWPEGGVGVERGPLVYALPVKARRVKDPRDKRSNRKFPAWSLYPAEPWNYALAPRNKKGDMIQVIEREPVREAWDTRHAHPTLLIPARRVPGWTLVRRKSIRVKRHGKTERIKGNYRMTPALPPRALLKRVKGPARLITLVPFGCTHLRLTIFPQTRPD